MSVWEGRQADNGNFGVAGGVIFTRPRPAAAMEGRRRAYMDVLVACPGKLKHVITAADQ